MDRLPLVKRWMPTALACAYLGLLPACDEPSVPSAAAGRVVAVAAKQTDSDLAHLCDVRPAPGERPFAWPLLAGDAPPSASGWRWINVWASWCKPCIEELPLIERTLTGINARGTTLSFAAVSADADAASMQSFEQRFSVLKGTGRVADPSQVADWATTLGLDAGATLPLHVFVDPSGNVRCARAGAISEADMALVGELVR